jgi:hypothetical protein
LKEVEVVQGFMGCRGFMGLVHGFMEHSELDLLNLLNAVNF